MEGQKQTWRTKLHATAVDKGLGNGHGRAPESGLALEVTPPGLADG